MKAVKTKKEKEEKNWALPGVKLTHEEFLEGIHAAEKGPFFPIEEIQIMRNQWRESKS
jgi:hypothetical protein